MPVKRKRKLPEWAEQIERERKKLPKISMEALAGALGIDASTVYRKMATDDTPPQERADIAAALAGLRAHTTTVPKLVNSAVNEVLREAVAEDVAVLEGLSQALVRAIADLRTTVEQAKRPDASPRNGSELRRGA